MAAPRDEEGRAKAINALARGLGITAAAEEAGLARPFLSRLVNHDPAFQQQIEAARAAIAKETAERVAREAASGKPKPPGRVTDEELEQLERGALAVLSSAAQKNHDLALQLVRAVDIIARRRAGKRPAEGEPAPAVANPPRLKSLAGGWV